MTGRKYGHNSVLAKIIKLYISTHPYCTASEIAYAIDRAKIGINNITTNKVSNHIKTYNNAKWFRIKTIRNGRSIKYKVKE